MSTKAILIVANPKAGKGKPIRELPGVERYLLTLGFSVRIYLTKCKSDYTGIAGAVNEKNDISGLIVIGGDGTLNDVVNSLPIGYPSPIVVLPCGSGNDFATFLYRRKSYHEILSHLLTGQTIDIDIGECNGKKFINGLGIGFDGWVAKKANSGPKWIPVSLKYNLAILRGLFTYRSFYTNLGHSLIIAVANGPTYGGGFKIAPEADPSDGMLDLWQIKPIPVFLRPYFLTLIKKGGHAHKKTGPYHHQKIRNISIQSQKKLPAHLDGEYFEADRFEVNLSGMKLKFIC